MRELLNDSWKVLSRENENVVFLGVTLSQKDQPQQEEYLCYHDKLIDNTNNQITYVLELFSFKSILIT